jgi:O-antigen/teichoic acid export membrane protein
VSAPAHGTLAPARDEEAVAAIAAVTDGQATEGAADGRAPGALLMSLGTVGSGLLAYAFNAVAARTLGPDAYGPIAVLWAAMCLIAVVLFRPIEQTLSRAVAERTAAGQDARTVVRPVAALAVGIALAVIAGCALAWSAITDRLFDGQNVLTAMLIVGVAGYGASYFMRGLVGGRRWYAGYGVLLLADGGVRLALVLPLYIWASTSLAAAALAAAAIAGAVAPLVLRGRTAITHLSDAEPGRPFRLGSAAGFAASTTVLAAGDQILLSGGPVLVMLQGGEHASKAAGLVFAATMLVRAPAYLFQGVAAALLPNLTTMLVRDDQHGFRRAVGRTVAILAGFSSVMVLGAFLLGPFVMRVLYGDGFDTTGTELALLAAGAGGYLVAATLSQAALARSEPVGAAAIWAASAMIFVALELVLPGSPLFRVSVAFCVATLANAAAFAAFALTRRTGARTAPTLRLAASGGDQ